MPFMDDERVHCVALTLLGEKHEATGHSFVAEVNYDQARGRDCTRVVSCNTTSIVRTLTALKRAGLLRLACLFPSIAAGNIMSEPIGPSAGVGEPGSPRTPVPTLRMDQMQRKWRTTL